MDDKKPVGFSIFVMFFGVLLLFILNTTILLPIRSAFADSYDDGSDEGCFDARRDLQGLNGHGYDESVNHGDSEFRTGYVDGYRDCWNQGNDQSPPQDTDREQASDSRSFDRSQTDGFDWTGICNTLQPALYSSCDSLVNSDGSLTYEGNRALTCIRNGALLAAGAGLSSIPLGFISRGLQALEGPTGCGGIVNWNMVNQIGNVATILDLLP